MCKRSVVNMGEVEHKRTFPLFRPMSTEILLSLLSLSSFFDFFSSDDVAAPLSLLLLAASLFSLSECRLRFELEPFSNEPKLNTDDFFADPGTACGCRFVSFGGDIEVGARRW